MSLESFEHREKSWDSVNMIVGIEVANTYPKGMKLFHLKAQLFKYRVTNRMCPFYLPEDIFTCKISLLVQAYSQMPNF